MTERDVKIRIQSQNAATPGISAAKQEVSALGKAASVTSELLKGMGLSLGTLAASRVGEFFKDVFDKGVEQQRMHAQLSASLSKVGASFEESKGSIKAFASELKSTTLLTGSEVETSLNTLVRLTGDFSTQSYAAVAAAADLSKVTGQGLAEATKAVGRALNGNVGELGQLVPGLRGVTTETLAAMDASQRYSVVLGAINDSFGGAAKAVDATSLAIKNFTDAWGGFKKSLGESLVGGGAFEVALGTMTKKIKDLSGALDGDTDSLVKTFLRVNPVTWAYAQAVDAVTSAEDAHDKAVKKKIDDLNKLDEVERRRVATVKMEAQALQQAAGGMGITITGHVPTDLEVAKAREQEYQRSVAASASRKSSAPQPGEWGVSVGGGEVVGYNSEMAGWDAQGPFRSSGYEAPDRQAEAFRLHEEELEQQRKRQEWYEAEQEYQRQERDYQKKELDSKLQLTTQGIKAAQSLSMVAVNGFLASENMKQMSGKLLQQTGGIVAQFGGAYGAVIGAAMQFGGSVLQAFGDQEEKNDQRRKQRDKMQQVSPTNPLPVRVMNDDVLTHATTVNLYVQGASLTSKRELGRLVNEAMAASNASGMTRSQQQGAT